MGHENHLISVHVEKTAGTSLHDYLAQLFGKSQVLQYIPTSNIFLRTSDIGLDPTNPIINWVKRNVSASKVRPLLAKLYAASISENLNPHAIKITDLPTINYSVIHGHFIAGQFEQQVTRPIYAIVIRNPIDRMYSHFVNWQRANGQSPWRIHVPFDSNISFEDFALLPSLQNYQTQALGKIPIDAFTFVGTTEHLTQYFDHLLQKLPEFGFAVNQSRHDKYVPLNQTPNMPKLSVDPQFRAKFESWHAEDVALYNYANSVNV